MGREEVGTGSNLKREEVIGCAAGVLGRGQWQSKGTWMSDADRVLAAALAAGTHTTPTPQTALSKLRAGRSVLKTGVAALDCMLRGGFPCRSLRSRPPHFFAACSCCVLLESDMQGLWCMANSELCGEAGSGKTQLLLQVRDILLCQCAICPWVWDSPSK